MTVSVVGIGGSVRTDSQSERALRLVLEGAQDSAVVTSAISGRDLLMPFYDPHDSARGAEAKNLVEKLRAADGVVLVSPGYHGTVSGLIKNAIDHVEDLREDERVYLDGRAVGCVAVAAGWQAAVNTLGALRDITHSVRAWPTPLGVAVNSLDVRFDEAGGCSDLRVAENLRMVGAQVAEFALRNSK